MALLETIAYGLLLSIATLGFMVLIAYAVYFVQEDARRAMRNAWQAVKDSYRANEAMHAPESWRDYFVGLAYPIRHSKLWAFLASNTGNATETVVNNDYPAMPAMTTGCHHGR